MGGTYAQAMEFAELAKHGLEPTPSAMLPVIVAFLERKGGATRSEIVGYLESEWRASGGTQIDGSRSVSRVKKALSSLQASGIVENPAHGFYRLLSEGSDGMTLRARIEGAEGETYFDADEADADGMPLVAETVLGEGSQFIYAFYLPTYRRLAEGDGKTVWPLKIGMTTTSVDQRMASHRTALPEEPSIALVIRTHDAALLEKIIQGMLTLRGQRMDSGGSEWFETNPTDIISIYEFAVAGPVREPVG